MKLTPLFFLSLTLTLFSCATAQKDPPSVAAQELPALKFEKLKPRTLRLEVKNGRKVNLAAKNSEAVEAAIVATLREYFANQKITLNEKSVNHLSFEFLDYGKYDVDGECVELKSTFKTQSGSMRATAHACSSSRYTVGANVGGDISEAFKLVLENALTGLDSGLGEIQN